MKFNLKYKDLNTIYYYNYNYNIMPQLIILTSEEEDNKVKEFSKEWKLSKMETIKRMIQRFEENNGNTRWVRIWKNSCN